ncbi:MAG: hypothetical protein HONBIEJF_00931 [Fimbriimonadaceae bacterium]|nr:hypothetical protein [Fimbriimonadaceae bacterium]
MSRLTLLRIARWAKGKKADTEHPNLETLIDEESVKVSDGYHYARWITPLVGLTLAAGCFLPLALTVHPLFWIGVAGMALIGGALGAVFHAFATRISPSQLALRKRCVGLANKLTSARHLLGVTPVISPKVAAVLDDAAKIYLQVRPNGERDLRIRATDAWTDASQKALRAMDEAMAQLLTLTEPASPQAQEAALAQGWAEPLLAEMRATAAAICNQRIASQISGASLHPAASSLSELTDARAHLERLDSALQELNEETVREQA